MNLRIFEMVSANYRRVVSCAVLAALSVGAQQGIAQNASRETPPDPPRGNEAFAPGLVIKPVEERKNVTPIPPPPPGSPPPSPDPRNLEGIWLLGSDISMQGEPPRLTPSAAAEQRRRQAYAAKGTPLGGLGAQCRPSASQILNLGLDLFPAEIIQTPDKIVILNEEGRGRWQIFLNRALPKQPTPSYSGHSVGRWEGDTLVVETVGIIDQWGMTPLTKHSRLTHRLRKLDGGRRLEMKATTEDAGLFTTPFQSTTYSIWHPELQLLEFQCEENREGAREGVVFEE